MSEKLFGMPGINGSLGKCALCGESFLIEILLHRTVATIEAEGCEGRLCAHHACIDKFDGKPVSELPDASPLKQAALRHNENQTGDTQKPQA
jgi:hypothetical protein